MQGLIKNSKTLLTVPAIIWGVINTGCSAFQQVPDPPDINLYMHSKTHEVALCTSVKTGLTCPAVDMGATKGWFMLAPQDWEQLQNYIDILIYDLENRAEVIEKSGNSYSVSANDLRAVAKRLRTLKKKLRSG
jgi:hypothetical protein